jgi:hypothetical protein
VAFPWQSILMLLGEHKERPFEGPVLTLGRQTVYINYSELLNLFAQAGVEPVPLPGQSLPDRAAGARIWGDRIFFDHLGLESMALDVSDYEDAEIVHDLNVPIGDELRGRFGLVIDGGTLEHVFDIRTAFANVAELAAPGGRVIHMTPCNNYVNHGFWQVSPTSFFDFYEANGFVDLKATMIVQPRDIPSDRAWATFPYNALDHGGVNSFFSSRDDQLSCMFSAVKTSASTSDRVPTQSFFGRLESALAGEAPLTGFQYTLELTAEGLRMVRIATG